MVGRKTKILETIGIVKLCEYVEDGLSQAAISKMLNVNCRTLNDFLNRQENVEYYRKSLEASAEAWLDRGLSVIESALNKDSGIDSHAARAYAQECARRASIRNRSYGSKNEVHVSGKMENSLLITKIQRVIVDPSM